MTAPDNPTPDTSSCDGSSALPRPGDTVGGGDRQPSDSPDWTPTPGQAGCGRRAAPRAPLSALLLGPDYTVLGRAEVTELDPTVAIGISRGRFRKGYPHIDPNEDAVLASTDDSTTVLAVADGHRGFNAAHAAIGAIAEASGVTADLSPDAAVRYLANAAAASVEGTVPLLDEPRNRSATALTIAVVRHGSLATCTIGDTACFVVAQRRVACLGSPTPFLSSTGSTRSVAVQTASVASGSTVVVTSDGFIDFVGSPYRAMREARGLSVGAAVAHLIDAAFVGGAGDNIAIAMRQEA